MSLPGSESVKEFAERADKARVESREDAEEDWKQKYEILLRERDNEKEEMRKVIESKDKLLESKENENKEMRKEIENKDKEIESKDKIIARLEDYVVRRDKEREDLQTELQRTKGNVQSFMLGHNTKLPFLGPRAVGASSTSKNRRHKNAAYVEKAFGILPTVRHDVISKILSEGQTNNALDGFVRVKLSWATEASLLVLVVNLIDDILAALRIKTMSIHVETPLLSFRPDCTAIMRDGKPVGIVEVKVPSKDPATAPHVLLNPTVVGQIYDYLLFTCIYYGIDCPMAIGTTYDGWVVFWLSSETNDRIAAATDRSVLEGLANLDPSQRSNSPPDLSKRELSCTRVLRLREGQDDSAEIVATLETALEKMRIANQKTRPLTELRAVVQYNAESFVIMNQHKDTPFKVPTPEELYLSSFPTECPTAINIIKRLGSGGEGRAFVFSVPNQQSFGVVKFPNHPHQPTDASVVASTSTATAHTSTASFEKEKKARGLLKEACFVTNYNGCQALLVPYARPLTEEERGDPALRGMVEDVIEKHASLGIDHNDLKWSHVGFIGERTGTGDVSKRLVFIDYGQALFDQDKTACTLSMSEALNLR